jgi:internalin A
MGWVHEAIHVDLEVCLSEKQMELRGKNWDNQQALAKIGEKKVRSLNLYNTSIDDDFLAVLAPRGGLKSIHIVSEIITDRGIELLAQQNELESLLLAGVPKVTDASLDSLAHCSSIRELYLTGTAITDRRLECLKKLPKLWSLSIGNTSITDEGIRKIASRTISLISFENCAIEGHGFASWSQPDKMSFYGNGSRLTDAGFATVCASFPQLWNVVISNTRIGNDGIRALAGQAPTLLRIQKSNIDRRGIEWIVANLPVHALEVAPTQMTQAEAHALVKPQGLRISVYE